MLPRTYRSRLITYSILLISFLTGTLVYTYHYTRNFMLQESGKQLSSAVLIHHTLVQKNLSELTRHAKLLSNDLMLKEYIKLANLSGDTGPLRRLLKQAYAWFPNNHTLVFSNGGYLLIGLEQQSLASDIRKHLSDQTNADAQAFYIQNGPMELIVTEPVLHRGRVIGTIALTHSLEQNWQGWHSDYKNGDIFISRDNKVIYSTSKHFIGLPFEPQENHIGIGDETYRLYPATFPSANDAVPKLWYGISETRLLNTLVQQGEQTLSMVIIGGLGILLVGLAIIRSFNRPLSTLINVTNEVAKGNLPNIKHTPVRTEIDLLINHFADMIDSLKEKQAQIDEAHKELQKSAITDTLTGLYNRRHLQDLFPKLQAQARRDQRIITAILCDLDYFKQLNDKYGHMAGDKALVEFSSILKRQSRNNDFLYRMGGEEFLILSVSEDNTGSKILAEKIRASTREHVIVYKTQMIGLTVSCGVSHTHPNDAPEAALHQLLSRADKALYQAKQLGRNQVRVFEELGKPKDSSQQDHHHISSAL